MWIFGFSLGVCSMEPCSLVPSLEYLVSNGRQVLLGGISLDGSATEWRGTSRVTAVAAAALGRETQRASRVAAAAFSSKLEGTGIAMAVG